MSEELDRDMMTVTKRGIKNRDNEIERLTADLAAANAKGDKWRLALESLTAQGSEFHNDLDRCVAYVRERYAEGHKAKGDRVKMQREIARLTADLAAANEALRVAVEGLEEYERQFGSKYATETLAKIDSIVGGENE